jgi:hypothetical protein
MLATTHVAAMLTIERPWCKPERKALDGGHETKVAFY